MELWSIGAILVQDGITVGAVYALLGMALVLVFAVTRVILFAQGEFVVYAALTLATLQAGRAPGTAWLLGGLALLACGVEMAQAWKTRDRRRARAAVGPLCWGPLALAVLALTAQPQRWPLLLQCLLSLALVTPMGPLVYRIVYQPISKAPVLVLLIASVGVHFVLTGLGLVFFGVEGFRTPSFSEAQFEVFGQVVSGQALAIVTTAVALIAVLSVGFGHTLQGKALKAAASNAVGAELMGISVPFSGALSFGIAAFIGALCGLLIGPLVTVYYDSGLLIGLKGFVAAIVGGLASYPLTLAGALGVGVVEAFAAFWASAFKDVIVFLLVLPVLWGLSLHHGADEEH